MKNIIKYFPLLSVLLIFLGYCHLHFFYCSQFDIDIYQFITTGEIVLSFLPIAFVLFIIGIILGIVLVIGVTEEDKKVEKPKKARYLPFTSYQISTGKGYNWSVYQKLYSRDKKKLKLHQKIFLLYKQYSHVQFLLLIVWIY